MRMPMRISTTTVGSSSRGLSCETIVASAAAQKMSASEMRSGSGAMAPYTRADERGRPGASACALDGDLHPRYRPLPRAGPRPGDRGRLLLRRLREDQRLHGRLADPEPDPRLRGRRGALGRLRPRLQRAPGEGGEGAGLARRVHDLLA